MKRLSSRDEVPEVALTFLKRLPGGAEIKERKFGGLKNDPRRSGEVFCSDPCKENVCIDVHLVTGPR